MKKFWTNIKYFFSKDVWGDFFNGWEKVITPVIIFIIVALLLVCFANLIINGTFTLIM